MSYRLLFIIGIILLFYSPQSSFKRSNEKAGDSLSIPPLTKAYILGNKNKLKKSQIKVHKNLNLMHLMTPSGLHLSCLLLRIAPLLKRKLFKTFFLFILLIFLGNIPGFDSFKRMILFSILKINPFVKFNSAQSFLLTFLIYFIQGQYFENPLSFTLSFLFLGALLFSKNRLETFFLLITIQTLLSFYFDQKFYFLGSIYGLLLSLSSILIFPLITLDSILPSPIFSSMWMEILSFFNSIKGPSISSPFIFLFIFYMFMPHKRLLKVSIPLIIIFYSDVLTPLKRRPFKSPPPINYVSKINIKNGVKLRYKNGLVCRHRLYVDQWGTHCSK